MSHERAQELLREAGLILTNCQQAFDANQPVDVLPMQGVVTEFCTILQALPKREAALYEEPLDVMMEGLRALEQLLAQRRDELKQAAQSLNQNQAAAAAYKKFSSNDNE